MQCQKVRVQIRETVPIRLIASVEAVLDGLKSLDQRNPAVVQAMAYLLEGIVYIGFDNKTALKWLRLCLWSLKSDV